MKPIALAIVIACLATTTMAQQNQGKITYQRTIQMQIRIADDNNGSIENMLPRERKDKFELSFANNQTLWKQLDEPDQEGGDATWNTNAPGGGGGVQIRMIGPGADDIMYCNLGESRRTEERELGTKKYIVADSIRAMQWKLSDETKTILGHTCRKATSQRIGSRVMMNMDNGKMERKEVSDTSNIVAWFTSDIPLSSGPAEYQGQLPGLILEMDVSNGRTIYKALEISPKVDVATIKEPKGKKITQEQFNKERDKFFEEMNKNAGPGRSIRINN